MNEKRCSHCKEVKPRKGGFYFDKKTGRYTSWCCRCFMGAVSRREKEKLVDPEYRNRYNARKSAARRRRYANVPGYQEAVLERNRIAAKALKDRVFAAYGGYRCVCCGETEPIFLAIDHLDNRGRQHRRAIGGGGAPSYRWLTKNGFPVGYQVLCYNCNWGKHINGGVCPHQTPEGSEAISQESTHKRGEAPGSSSFDEDEDMVRSLQ